VTLGDRDRKLELAEPFVAAIGVEGFDRDEIALAKHEEPRGVPLMGSDCSAPHLLGFLDRFRCGEQASLRGGPQREPAPVATKSS